VIGLAIATSAWATTDTVTFDTTPSGGTVVGGQTVGWGYTIQNLSSYWFMPTGVTASGWTYATPIPSGDIFDYPILAPNQTTTVNYQYSATGSTGLFEIQWNTGLPFNTHETGFFTLSGDFYTADPFGGGTFAQAAPDVSTPYDASAPEPISLLLFGTAFGVALWGKSRVAAKRLSVVQAERQV
jgi:hypothetical protein